MNLYKYSKKKDKENNNTENRRRETVKRKNKDWKLKNPKKMRQMENTKSLEWSTFFEINI